MNFVAPDFMPVLPELFVLTMTCLVLVVDVFLEQRQRHITYGLAQLTLLGAAMLIAGVLTGLRGGGARPPAPSAEAVQP